MVKTILEGIIPYKEVRFIQPPRSAYAVYFDNIENYGADDLVKIENHSIRIEVYSTEIERDIESQIEDRMIQISLEFNKGERTWLNTEQLYMTPYYIDYTKKKEE